jgi:hypothetical protein
VNDPPSLSHADHRPFEEYEAILDAPNVASALALPQSAGDQHKDHIRESTDPRAPTIDEPARRSLDEGDAGVTKVAFSSSSVAGVTEMSHPCSNEEQFTCYYFKVHARQCDACQDPLMVAKAGRQLCRIGRDLAVDIFERSFFRRKDKPVCSRVRNGEKTVRVELPDELHRTVSLLMAVDWAAQRGETWFEKSKLGSMNSNHFSDDEPQSEHIGRRRTTTPTNFSSPVSTLEPQRHYRDLEDNVPPSSDSYIDDMRRLWEDEKPEQAINDNLEISGSDSEIPKRPQSKSADTAPKNWAVYSEELRRLEETIKHKVDIEYNLEIREPNYKSPRQSERTQDEDTVRPGSPSR